jgi:hypothetical protein
VTVVPNAIFAGGENAIIAVARAFGSRIVPAGGPSTIENACDGIIVTEVMVSGALPVFAMTNFFSRATTRPKSIVAGVTASRLNRSFAFASLEVGCAEEVGCANARGAGATARKTQAQSAAMYRRIIAPQVTTTPRTSMSHQGEHKSPIETTESVKTYIIMPKCYPTDGSS